EVLAQHVGGSMALGFRNLSGDPTCQLATNLAGALERLKQGRQYTVRVEYQGQKEARGWLSVRGSDFAGIATGKLGPTDGRWEVVELPLEQEVGQARDLTFGTDVNGPATTLFIRSVVLVERFAKTSEDDRPGLPFSTKFETVEPFVLRKRRD